jgi:hypothetical protein
MPDEPDIAGARPIHSIQNILSNLYYDCCMGKEPLGGGHITQFAQKKINGLTVINAAIIVIHPLPRAVAHNLYRIDGRRSKNHSRRRAYPISRLLKS